MKTKKALLLGLIGILTILAIGVFAENNIDLMYNHIMLIKADLSIAEGKAACNSTLRPEPGYTGYLSMKLQKKNGTKWNSIANWSAKGSAGEIVSLSKSYTVNKGATYRVHIYAVIYDKSGNIIESSNANSNSVAY
ncbi:MAG: hypothetical protein ACOYIT_05310 [Christensenellales bacterium]|jgi:hypothetical protein